MATLTELRASIDQVDRQIIELLADRTEIVRKIGEHKRSDADIVAKDRQQQVYESRRAMAIEAGLDPDLAEKLYRVIIEYFIERQREQLQAKILNE